MRMKRKLFILLLITTLIGLLSSCNKKPKTGITQEFYEEYLITKAVYKGQKVWSQFDVIELNTTDSIKFIRYQEAQRWIDKYTKIDNFK